MLFIAVVIVLFGFLFAKMKTHTIQIMDKSTSKLLSFKQRNVTIGKRKENLIAIEDSRISGKHALISYDNKTKCYYINDLNSLNGTFVNGVRISNKKLKPGDEIALCGHNFKVVDF